MTARRGTHNLTMLATGPEHFALLAEAARRGLTLSDLLREGRGLPPIGDGRKKRNDKFSRPFTMKKERSDG